MQGYQGDKLSQQFFSLLERKERREGGRSGINTGGEMATGKKKSRLKLKKDFMFPLFETKFK